MKKIALACAMTFTSAVMAQTDVQKELKELRSRLEQIELESLSNSVKMSSQLENRYDVNTYKNAATPNDGNHVSLFSTYYRLNMESKVDDNLEFHGRVSMAKFWNDTYSSNSGNPVSLSTSNQGGGRVRSDSSLWVERAFLNWQFRPNWFFTVGRLPTVDGAPRHFMLGAAPMGAYPAQVFSRFFDGAAITKGFSGNGWTLKTRLVYIPYSMVNQSNIKTQYTNSDGQKVDSTTNQWVGNLEFFTKNLSFADSFTSILQGSYTSGYTYTNAASFPASGTQLTSNLKLLSRHLTWYNEFENLFDTGTDFYISGKLADRNSDGAVSSSGSVGYYTSSNYRHNHGYNLLTGARKSIDKYFIGAEYVYNSLRGYSPDVVYQDLINFYGTPATKGYHLYGTIPLNRTLTTVVGFMQQKQWATYSSSLGDPVGKDITNTSYYLRLVANF